MPAPTKAALVLLVFIALLALRVELLWRTEAAATAPRYVGTTQTIVGVVTSDPDVRDTGVRVNLRVEQIASTSGSGTLLVVLPKNTHVAYGDTLVVRGAISSPQAFLTDTGRTFDYPTYLRVQGVSAVIERASVVSRTPSGWTLLGTLFSVKHAFERSVERIYPAQDAALMEGVLLGERHGLPDAAEQALVAAGLIHIVILAGYALSLVSQGVLDVLSPLPPRARYLLAAVALLCYVLMTGAAATTVRAALMAAVAMIARVLRRPSVAMRSLIAVAACMLLYNPLYILDESFVISVAATFGLITIAPVCERWLRWLPERWDARGIAASTMAVQIFALPALLYYTGTLSLYALPANLIALPALPWVMGSGFVAGALGFISPLLSIVPALVSNVLLHYMLAVANIAAHLSWGGASIPPFSGWMVVAIYIPLTFAALRTFVRRPTN